MPKKLISLFFAIFLGVSLAWFCDSGASAQGNEPPWKQVLTCEPGSQHYKGIEYCTKQGQGNPVYVVVIDLNAAGIGLEYVIANGYDRNKNPVECRDVNLPDNSIKEGCVEKNTNYYPVMALNEAANRFTNTALVIDSDYGAGDHGKPGEHRGHGPEGLAVIQKQRIDGKNMGDTDNNAENRPWVAIGKGSPIRVEFNQFSKDEDTGFVDEWIYTAFGGGPWLIRNGVVVPDIKETCLKYYPTSCYKDADQTSVGISSDRRWLFFVIYRKSSLDLHETVELLKSLDVADAIKLDGGGSSQLYYAGTLVLPGDGRRLSQYLAVIAQKGQGIELGNSPEPPGDEGGDGGNPGGDTGGDTGGSSPWEAFWAWLLQLLTQKLLGWLNQSCGLSSLMPVTLAFVWALRRHRNKP
jgi:hypothetical protein